jgi:hypothetical protein
MLQAQMSSKTKEIRALGINGTQWHLYYIEFSSCVQAFIYTWNNMKCKRDSKCSRVRNEVWDFWNEWASPLPTFVIASVATMYCKFAPMTKTTCREAERLAKCYDQSTYKSYHIYIYTHTHACVCIYTCTHAQIQI